MQGQEAASSQVMPSSPFRYSICIVPLHGGTFWDHAKAGGSFKSSHVLFLFDLSTCTVLRLCIALSAIPPHHSKVWLPCDAWHESRHTFICDSTDLASSGLSVMMEKQPMRWPYSPIFLAYDWEQPMRWPSSRNTLIA